MHHTGHALTAMTSMGQQTLHTQILFCLNIWHRKELVNKNTGNSLQIGSDGNFLQ